MAVKNAQLAINSDLTQTSNKERKIFSLTPVRQAVLMACGASLAVGAAPIVMAQEVAALEEIIVTARKRSENLQDVPVSVLAFGKEAIEKQGIIGLEDYARLIPSLTRFILAPQQFHSGVPGCNRHCGRLQWQLLCGNLF